MDDSSRDEASAFTLSAAAEALHRVTEYGSGCLSTQHGVRYEGWMLKEAGLAGGWHMRYFFVNESKLEYFKEHAIQLTLTAAEKQSGGIGVLRLSDLNVVLGLEGSASAQRTLQKGDLIIGVNGEPVVNERAETAIGRATGSKVLQLTVLRPKGTIQLAGASVSIGGGRKQGGYPLTVGTAEKKRHTFVCADERSCFGWTAAIKEAVAAAAMEQIKRTISQALSLQLHGGAPLGMSSETALA